MNPLRLLLSERCNRALKNRVMRAVHAESEIVSRLATRVAKRGVENYLSWSYDAEKARLLACLEKRRAGAFTYTFSISASVPTVYSSAYACMILGLVGELETLSAKDRRKWADYFDSFQSEKDGFFRDPALMDGGFESGGAWGGGWGMWHLAAHLAIVYGRLGFRPKHRLTFLDPFFDPAHLETWLGRFDFSANVWSQSNHIMNLYSLLEFARDFMGETRAGPPLERIAEWLLERQNAATGMWHTYDASAYPNLGDAIRGAYHFFPLFSYENRSVPFRERVIDAVLSSQNSWGAFENEKCPAGACEDIDAVEPLVRFSRMTGYRREEALLSARRSLVWVFSCRNADGGYESSPENGCAYGGHPFTSSAPGESNLFATWFRTLTIAYLADFTGLPNGYQVGRFPGYEITLAAPSGGRPVR